MKLTFDPNLSYQLDAIKSITDLFEGQPIEDTATEYQLTHTGQQSLINGIANNLTLSDQQLLKNLQHIQKRNNLPISTDLDHMQFSVEMETGTGKTYVYLRTIYELFAQYQFKKFVIVVPSVAIREGVLKSLQITHKHLQNKYDHPPIHFNVYQGKQVSKLRTFATGNHIEILVINIDAFTKDENIINKPNDRLSGQRPITFIQATHPIVIVDEPQNMETDKRKKAIHSLNPLCTLRYSATHKKLYNCVYSLNPVKAYDLGLVKQIDVTSVIEENAQNSAFIEVQNTKATKTKVLAKLAIHVNTPSGVKKKAVTVKQGDDLYTLSNQREIYKNAFIVEQIDPLNRCITLSNGILLFQGERQGDLTEEVMKSQIRATIEEHLKKESILNSKGIKVLSLFFIDRVANYRQYDAQHNPSKGKFALWFEELYQELIDKMPRLKAQYKHPLSDIHNGYFALDKQRKTWKDIGERASINSALAADTFNLIMKDKEKLLDMDNPLRFIFSHSALREGWDNPNVFQICTLNETQSEIKKRQEIGRGLRLAVDQKGNRTYDRHVNRLTVIANEAYEDFAKALQKEIEEDCGVPFDKIKNARDRKTVSYRKGFEADKRFLDIWNKVKHQTTYRVSYQTDEVIEKSAKAIAELPEIIAPSIRVTKTSVDITHEGVEGQYAGNQIQYKNTYHWKIPDVLGYI